MWKVHQIVKNLKYPNHSLLSPLLKVLRGSVYLDRKLLFKQVLSKTMKLYPKLFISFVQDTLLFF